MRRPLCLVGGDLRRGLAQSCDAGNQSRLGCRERGLTLSTEARGLAPDGAPEERLPTSNHFRTYPCPLRSSSSPRTALCASRLIVGIRSRSSSTVREPRLCRRAASAVSRAKVPSCSMIPSNISEASRVSTLARARMAAVRTCGDAHSR